MAIFLPVFFESKASGQSIGVKTPGPREWLFMLKKLKLKGGDDPKHGHRKGKAVERR